VQIKAVISDNRSAYIARSYRAALAKLGLRHLRIRPYRPAPTGRRRDPSRRSPTSGPTSASTAAQTNAPQLNRYLERYNFRRPTARSATPPASRLMNVIRNYFFFFFFFVALCLAHPVTAIVLDS
jgi:transposase InsO family protein